ncbi:MAG: inorganic diphosphatase [Prevotella sp.]|nr:inorganic diphosphatase [Staphylococcus sp.]MCM1350865.1 inorganic diphosphatase [Prevotella sp.]
MNIWHDIEKDRIHCDDFYAVIEISKGSKNKYELDKKTGLIMLDRILYTSTHYPANYGFIPLTYANDLDPLDVLVLCSEALVPMSLVRCYPIGVIRMIDGNYIDDKIVAIPFHDPNLNHYKELEDVPEHMINEMSHFFSVYKNLEHKTTTGFKLEGKDVALQIIQDALFEYENKKEQLKNEIIR